MGRILKQNTENCILLHDAKSIRCFPEKKRCGDENIWNTQGKEEIKHGKNNLNSTYTTDPLLGAFTYVFIFTTFYIGENWLRELLTLDHTISYWILKQDLPDFQSLQYFYSFS